METPAARVLVVKLGALGDVLLAEGALRDIREHHPGARISLLTRRPFSALLRRCPWVDAVLVDENHPRWRLDAMWRLARRLRAERFDLAYDLQNSRRSAFYLTRLLRGVTWSGTDARATLRTGHPAPATLPVLQRHAVQLIDAGLSARHAIEPRADWLCDPVDDLLDAARVQAPFAVLLPGSSARGAAKRWPHYAELAKRLAARGLLPVTVPGPEELDAFGDFPGICLRTPDGRALDLHALAGVLRRAAAVVGNDSGPTHLAASLGLPGVALFGTDAAQAARTCLGRRRMRALVSPGFKDLDAIAVDACLAEAMQIGA